MSSDQKAALFAAPKGVDSSVLKSARRFAVQFVYQCELSESLFFQDSLFRNFVEQQAVPPEIVDFLKNHVQILLTQLEEIDGAIQANSKNWKMHRIAKVDLAILRVCTAELKFRQDLTPQVIISDAAEIGKEFGSGGSGGFINGVLDGILKSRN